MPDTIRMGEPPAGFVPVTAGVNRLTVPAFHKVPGATLADIIVCFPRPRAEGALPVHIQAMVLIETNPIPSVQEVAP